MLVRLFAKNYGVFRDGFDLSLEATPLGTDINRGYFEVQIEGEDQPLRLLRLAAIYGPNGSGKSTVVAAAQKLLRLAIRSGPRSQQDDPIREYDPFLFDPASSEAPCVLGCEVVVKDPEVVEGKVVEYRVTFNKDRIVEESAVEKRDSGDRVWFTRNAEGAVRVSESSLSGPLAINLSEVTRPNATVLSVAAQLKQEPLTPLFDAVRRSLRTLTSFPSAFGSMDYSIRKMHEEPAFRKWALECLLKPADIGITDVTTEERAMPKELVDHFSKLVDEGKLRELPNQLKVVFSHQGVGKEYRLDFGKESSGTKKMLALTRPWYDVVHDGLTAFVDELSASLHPTLLIALLEALNTGPEQRPSQMIFTVHDPSPLEEALRRDQIYFTEKDDSGVAKLFSLADFRERHNTNIRKRYLEGRFGALPRLPNFESIFEPTSKP